MYRQRDREQQYLEDFRLPFGGKLRADSQWVKLAAMMPWDCIEEVYARSMNEVRGVKAITARLAFGARLRISGIPTIFHYWMRRGGTRRK